ncbi:hypothetical protein Sango_2578100 [Sesamum angolense]|uniref:DUF7865 domain-containing protein n=1 Tax=Sesamum angolense TaxID=2727404 RepID=A0AAE1W5B2_9LAMI|nr:hypothetical protein Sango_2578100 [Sesamum angolense]
MMMFYRDEVFVFSHGKDHASKLLGSTPHDQLLIRTSDSFSGLLLFAIGFFLFMVAFVKDREFHSFFARGCVLLHVAMAIWRVYFERKVEDLGYDWVRLVVGDIVLDFLGFSFLFIRGGRSMINVGRSHSDVSIENNCLHCMKLGISKPRKVLLILIITFSS